jgi:hypothetical protein
MPGGDRTGPLGYGPMTGRGAGFCAGYAAPGYVTPAFGRGRGFGGGGRGRRNMFYATGLPGWTRSYPVNPGWAGNIPSGYPGQLTPENEMSALKSQAGFFQNQITALNDRIRELEEIAARRKEQSE